MRLLFLTNSFPVFADPAKGMFNYYLTLALSRQHQVQVVAPISWVEEWGYRRAGRWPLRASRTRTIGTISVSHPRYYYPPKLLRSLYGWFYWYSVRSTLISLLDRDKPEAVISYWAHPDGEAALYAARRAGVPGVIIVGGSDILVLPRDSRRRRCIVRTLQAADAVVPVSEDLKARLIDLGVALDKIHVVPRGVDTSVFSPGDRTEARRRLGIALEGKVLVWVGRMVPVKGLDVLLRACVHLRNVLPFRLYLVGSGPLEQSLKDSCRALGLSDRVFFPGRCSHTTLGDWYRAADLTVLPSRSEGIPNVLRESLACGAPFVASDVGGIPELASLGPNRLTPPEDDAALAAAIAASLTESSPAVCAKQPSWEDSADRLVNVIRDVISSCRNVPVSSCPPATSPAPPRPDTRCTLAPSHPSFCRQMLRKGMTTLLPRRLFFTRGPSSSASIALTFDDGPHPQYTPRLLDSLAEQKTPATFFVIGESARHHPDLVRRMVAEGHTVGSHSYHPHSGLPAPQSFRQWAEDVRRTSSVLADILGDSVRLYRPPYGKVTVRTAWWLWRAGYAIALWNVDPKDYACTSADEVGSWLKDYPFAAGDIVLMHDNHPHIPAILLDVVTAVHRRGLTFAPLADWLPAFRRPKGLPLGGHILSPAARPGQLKDQVAGNEAESAPG